MMHLTDYFEHFIGAPLASKPPTGQMVRLVNNEPIGSLLHHIQIHENPKNNLCDTHIKCHDGFIPCHRYILMAQCAYLRELIEDNILHVRKHYLFLFLVPNCCKLIIQ